MSNSAVFKVTILLFQYASQFEAFALIQEKLLTYVHIELASNKRFGWIHTQFPSTSTPSILSTEFVIFTGVYPPSNIKKIRSCAY
jgi:hypothetical protein